MVGWHVARRLGTGITGEIVSFCARIWREYQGDGSTLSVVAMVPFHFLVYGHGNWSFLIEKVALDIIETDPTEDNERRLEGGLHSWHVT